MISAESDVRRHCFASSQPALSATASIAFSLAHVAHSADTEFSSLTVSSSKKGWSGVRSLREASVTACQHRINL